MTVEPNTIYNENCLDTMSRMPDGFVDLTVTSPPYDSLKEYNGYDFDFEAVAKELYRVTADGGVLVWVVNDSTNKGDESGTSFRQALKFKEIGFKLHDTMIWNKPNAFNFGSNYCYRQSFEYMFVFVKGNRLKTFNPLTDVPSKSPGAVCNGARRHANGRQDKYRPFSAGSMRKRSNVWNIPLKSDRSVEKHPAAFPEALAKDHILTWSNRGDLVYDPLAGSGTVAKMALLFDRNFICSEISPEYCDLAERRIAAYRDCNAHTL